MQGAHRNPCPNAHNDDPLDQGKRPNLRALERLMVRDRIDGADDGFLWIEQKHERGCHHGKSRAASAANWICRFAPARLPRLF